ncbi:MAG: hypothetical protein HDT21_05545 [Ruminococcus sp.]|nr:hypothetical protein [Ruminococcus sp.]
MSLISVDFVSLEIQVKRLEEYLHFLEETYNKIQYVFRIIENMGLSEIEDELRHVSHIFQDTIDDTVIDIAKLKRICELYNECENSITSAVIALPLNMPRQNNNLISAHKLNYLFNQNIGAFSGHSVINEEWLDKLIFGGGI